MPPGVRLTSQRHRERLVTAQSEELAQLALSAMQTDALAGMSWAERGREQVAGGVEGPYYEARCYRRRFR